MRISPKVSRVEVGEPQNYMPKFSTKAYHRNGTFTDNIFMIGLGAIKIFNSALVTFADDKIVQNCEKKVASDTIIIYVDHGINGIELIVDLQPFEYTL